MDKRKKQRWFDRAVKGLAGQGFERSVTSDDKCVYRAPGGKRCAVGHLIRDCDYDRFYEGMAVRSAVVNGLLVLGRRPSDDEQEFLSDLQSVHDYSTSEEMKGALKSFAKNHGLKIPRKLYGA